jgi:hypothetical protein
LRVLPCIQRSARFPNKCRPIYESGFGFEQQKTKLSELLSGAIKTLRKICFEFVLYRWPSSKVCVFLLKRRRFNPDKKLQPKKTKKNGSESKTSVTREWSGRGILSG